MLSVVYISLQPGAQHLPAADALKCGVFYAAYPHVVVLPAK